MTEKRIVNKSRATERKTRIPVSGNRNILTLENLDPAYNYRWVNDVEGRLNRFVAGGWAFATKTGEVGDRTADSSSGTSSVVSKEVGAGVTAYLMRIKMEWFEEDKAAKAAQIDKSEESMKRQLNSKEDASYGKVTIGGK